MANLTHPMIVSALTKLGVYPARANEAAADDRIAWTEAALAACVAYVKQSTAKTPGAVLWTQFLQHGKTPPILTPIDAPPVEPTCYACGGLLSDCEGLHGWAAAYRSTAVPLDEAAAA